MPDGDILMGRYFASSEGSVGFGSGMVGGRPVVVTTTTMATGGGISAQAASAKTTVICNGTHSNMRGMAICEMSTGERYQLMM